MKLEWSEAALADLDRFANFLHDRFPSIAAVVARELLAKSRILLENPRLGRPVGARGEFRQVVVRVLNAWYVMQYRVTDEHVVVLRVYHSRELREL